MTHIQTQTVVTHTGTNCRDTHADTNCRDTHTDTNCFIIFTNNAIFINNILIVFIDVLLKSMYKTAFENSAFAIQASGFCTIQYAVINLTYAT